jgi:hypothetical protein
MINGVLVERTVKEVKPALKTNSDGLKKVLDDLLIQYKTKQDEMDKWKVCSALRDLYYLSMLLLLSTALTKYMSLLLWFIKKYQTARVDANGCYRRRTISKWSSNSQQLVELSRTGNNLYSLLQFSRTRRQCKVFTRS